MQRDLGYDAVAIAAKRPDITIALEAAGGVPEGDVGWSPATRNGLLGLMGFPVPTEADLPDVAFACPPAYVTSPPTSPRNPYDPRAPLQALEAEPYLAPVQSPEDLFRWLEGYVACGGCPNPCDCIRCPVDGECQKWSCSGGTCVRELIVGGCTDDGNPCTVDECSGGLCVHLAGNDGAECDDDGNPCTWDICNGGTCTHPPKGFGWPCPDDGNDCTWDYCDSGGACVHPPKNNGTSCQDDGNPCTDDWCVGAGCAHPPADGRPCPDDGNPCTVDVCAAGGCTHPAGNDGASCADDGNPCTYDRCSGGSCGHPPNAAPCDDQDPCTTEDQCGGGVCAGQVKDCDDAVNCTTDSCDWATGACVHVPDDAQCNDGMYCSGVEACSAQGCQPGVNPCPSPLLCDEAHDACVQCLADGDCDDGDPCTDDSCWGWDPPPGDGSVAKGKCVNEPSCACLPCDDGDPCTVDSCADGACTTAPLCPPTQTCCNGFCCGQACCDECCDAGQTCCGGALCCEPEKCCEDDGTCCGIGQTGSAVAGGTCGLTVVIKEITFTSDHTMYQESAPCEPIPSIECWGAGAPLTGPDWKDVGNPDHPVCYTRGIEMRMTVVLQITSMEGGTATLRVVGEDGVNGTVDFTFGCGTTTVSMVTSPLPSVVEAYEPMTLFWSVKRSTDTGFSSIGTTQHDVYVTLGAPTWGLPTRRRMAFLCRAASGSWDDLTVTQAVHTADGGDPPNDPNDWPVPYATTDDWPIMHNARLPDATVPVGYCDHQAQFMDRGLLLLGAPGGIVGWIFATTDADPLGVAPETTTAAALQIARDLDGDGVAGETDEILQLIFDFAPPNEDWNNFEAFLQATGGFYAVWPNFEGNVPCDLYSHIVAPKPPQGTGLGAKQYWVYKQGGFITYVHPVEVEPAPGCR